MEGGGFGDVSTNLVVIGLLVCTSAGMVIICVGVLIITLSNILRCIF